MPLTNLQLNAVNTLNWLLEDLPSNRRTGRTTAVAVALLQYAWNHPGVEVSIEVGVLEGDSVYRHREVLERAIRYLVEGTPYAQHLRRPRPLRIVFTNVPVGVAFDTNLLNLGPGLPDTAQFQTQMETAQPRRLNTQRLENSQLDVTVPLAPIGTLTDMWGYTPRERVASDRGITPHSIPDPYILDRDEYDEDLAIGTTTVNGTNYTAYMDRNGQIHTMELEKPAKKPRKKAKPQEPPVLSILDRILKG